MNTSSKVLDETGKDRVAKTKYQIKYYVEDVMKLIAPENLYKDDRDKLRELLTLITTLSVFNIQLNSCWETKQKEMINDETNKIYGKGHVDRMWAENELIRTRSLLDKTSFNTKIEYVMLRLRDTKRFRDGKKWITASGTKPLTDPERYVTLKYSSRCKLASVEDILSTDGMNLHHESACMLRDHLSLVGELRDINLESPEIKRIREITDVLILKFESLYDIVTGHSQKPFIDSEFIIKETMYLEACRTMRRFLSINVIKAFNKKRHREKYTAKEFKIGTRIVLKLLEKEFISLPQDESQHPEYIARLSEEIVKILSKAGSTISNPKEKYVEFIQKEYERYMERIKDGTLPIRLSYLQEDKMLFEKLVARAREKQDSERKNGLLNLDFNQEFFLGMSMFSIAVISVMASKDNIETLIPTVFGSVSAIIMGNFFKYMRLNKEVSERLRFKRITIRRAHGIYYGKQFKRSDNKSKHFTKVLPQKIKPLTSQKKSNQELDPKEHKKHKEHEEHEEHD